MTLNIHRVIKEAAKGALAMWGQEDGLDDLVQELWVWYLESPKTQEKMLDLSRAEAVGTVRHAAIQMLSDQTLAGNTFQGRTMYSSEAVKDALKGRSTNRYLKDILPIALKALELQNEDHAEAIRRRYDDGTIPEQGACAQLLTDAHRSLTEQVNIIVITAGDVDRPHSVLPETRRSNDGGFSDPTADVAIALAIHGDDELELTDRKGNVTGTTTARKEVVGNVIDDFFGPPMMTDLDDPGDSVFDSQFNGAQRSELYRAQVFPELFPHEKPMLIENWPAEDREMYCGGEYTKGYYPRLVRGAV